MSNERIDVLALMDFCSIPRPIAPQPGSTLPQHEVPDDRTDFTREDEATGV